MKTITMSEAKFLLKRSPRMIDIYIKQGKLKKYKVLGQVVLDKQEVLNLLKPVEVKW